MAIRMRYVGAPFSHKDDDLATIKVLQEQSFGHVYVTTEFMKLSHWWILYDGKSPIGFCGLREYIDDPETVFLNLAGIIPGYRGRGYQRRLIKKREELAKVLGKKRIITYTSYDNLPSANNLIKCGYYLYEPRYQWGVEHAYYFQKFI